MAGLKNLKSIFNNLEPMMKTDLTTIQGRQEPVFNPKSDVTAKNSTLDDISTFNTPSIHNASDFTPLTNNDNITDTKYIEYLNQSPIGNIFKDLNPASLYTGDEYIFKGSTNYFENNKINSEAFPFSSDGVSKSYNNTKYDPRLGMGNVHKNTYSGTRFDDKLGGLFNEPDKYSTTFREINAPKLTDIISSGNIVTNEGYPNLVTKYETFNLSTRPDSYKGNGRYNVDASRGSWYVGANSTTANMNDFNTFETGVGKRTIIVGSKRYKGNKLGKGDLTFDSLYNHNQTSKFDDRLNIRYQGDGRVFGWRNAVFGFLGEPYLVSRVPKKGGQFWYRKPGRGLPIIRWGLDAARLALYATSPHGLLMTAFNYFRQTQNLRSHGGLDTGLPLPAFQGNFFSVFPYHTKADIIAQRYGRQRSNKEYTDSLEEVGGLTLLSMGNIYQVMMGNQHYRTSKFYVSGKPYWIHLYSLETGLTSLLFEKRMPFATSSAQSERGGLANLLWDYNPRTLAYGQDESVMGKMTPDRLGGSGVGTQVNNTPDINIGAVSRHSMGKSRKPVRLRAYYEIPFRQANDFYDNILDMRNSKDLKNAYWSSEYGDGTKAPFANVNDSIEPRGIGRDDKTATGDWMTLQPVAATDSNVDKKKLNDWRNGMPLYFKDLRDNRYIIFRAYVEGITESISPSWNGQQYIGRSEKAYTYTGAERDISFTLRMFAQTYDELTAIYGKLERLHGLAYPQYANDPGLEQARMRPPLCSFRLGDLFGDEGSDMTGFIKSLSFTYLDGQPWEIVQGRRVPKAITCAISFTVLHTKATPNWATNFLGFSYMEENFVRSFERVVPEGATFDKENAPLVTGLGGGPENVPGSGYSNRPGTIQSETERG